MRDIRHAVFDRERLHIVARPLTDFARHIDIRQEIHLDFLQSAALAGFTAAAPHIETEMAGGIFFPLCFSCRREQVANQAEHAGICRRVGTRRTPDRILGHGNHLVDEGEAFDLLVSARLSFGMIEILGQRPRQDIVHQARLARSGNSGDGHQHPERDLDIHIFQIMLCRTENRDGFLAQRPRFLFVGYLALAGKVLAGKQFRMHQFLRRTGKDDFAPLAAGARAQIDDVVRLAHDRYVMLDDHERIIPLAQILQRMDEPLRIAAVQSHRWLIQDIDDA